MTNLQLILAIFLAVDYDLYKQYADPENSEDPENIYDCLEIMLHIIEQFKIDNTE